ncbi:MAG: hypothetical protein Q4G05_00840 [Clostridia bacterium]|nr:hypothetical protein [Clostridia bacterium]
MIARKKSTLILIIVIGVILVAAAVISLYFTTDLLKTTEQLFYKFMGKNMAIMQVVEDEDLEGISGKKKVVPYEKQTDITVQDMNDDQSMVNKFKIVANTKVDEDMKKQASDIILKYNDLNLFDVSYKKQDKLHALTSSEIVSAYIAVKNENLKDLAKKIDEDIDINNVPNAITKTNYSSIINISDDDKELIYDTYGEIIKNNIGKDSFSKEKKVEIQIDGVNYLTTAYKLTLNNAESTNLVITLLETLKQDSVTLNLIVSKMKLVFEDESINVEYVNEKIQQAINKLRDIDMQNEKITLTVYTYKGELMRTALEIGSSSTLYELENKITGTVQRINLYSRMPEESVKYIFTKEKTINETIFRLNVNYLEGAQISISNITTGKVDSENIVREFLVEYLEGDTDYQISSKESTTFRSDLVVPELENEQYLIVNDCSSSEITQLTELLSAKIIEVFGEKMNLLGLVQ